MKVSINILWNDFNIPIHKEYSCTYEKLESFFPAFSPVRFGGGVRQIISPDPMMIAVFWGQGQIQINFQN